MRTQRKKTEEKGGAARRDRRRKKKGANTTGRKDKHSCNATLFFSFFCRTKKKRGRDNSRHK